VRPGPVASGPFASASLRVTLLVAGGIIALSLGAMALQYRITERALTARQDELLAAELAGFAQFYEQRRIPGLREAIEDRASVTPPERGLYLLQDRGGTRLAGNIADWPEGAEPRGTLFAPAPAVTFTRDGATYQGVARDLPGGFPFLAAPATAPVAETLATLRASIGRVALALVALGLVAGWLTARAVLGRIGRLNALAGRVAGGDLSARLPGPRSRDEFGALESHVHDMLDRIETLDRARHRLSDTVAHELRTPLNRIRQRLDRIEGPEGEVDAIRHDLTGTIRIFDALLDISAAEAASGQRPGLMPVDLSAIAAEVFDLYEALAQDKGLEIEARIAPGAMVLGERNLLAQLLSNLLDNAIKFTPPGDRVTLTLDTGPRHRLEVADSGPGMPEAIRATAFDPFTRAERDREVRGHGLGLALVQAIATRHGARIALPPADRGFRIEIAFPALTD